MTFSKLNIGQLVRKRERETEREEERERKRERKTEAGSGCLWVGHTVAREHHGLRFTLANTNHMLTLGLALFIPFRLLTFGNPNLSIFSGESADSTPAQYLFSPSTQMFYHGATNMESAYRLI